MTTEQLSWLIITEADAERVWKANAALQEEFESAKTLYFFAQAVRNGQVRIFRR